MIIRTTAAATAAAALAAVALAAPAAQAAPKRTPLFVSVLSPPAPVLGTDGRRHLAYELILGNEGGANVEVQSLAVRTKSGRTLQTIAGAAVPTAMQNLAYEPTATLGMTEGGRVWFDVKLPRHGGTPAALVHRFTVRMTFRDGTSQTSSFDAARTPVTRRPAIQVAPPLRGGLYLDFNGCCGHSAHRNALTAMDGVTWQSERYASDFIKIDAHGVGGAGDLSKNESFLTYGEPVLAVANAKVVSTLNTVPENVPLNEPPASGFSERAIVGNHVVLKLGPGRFAFYGHLKTGSVRVKVGQRVRTGQVIAKVGNTGPSGAAHLHFHVANRPLPLAAEALPYVFKRFRLAGEVGNVPEFLTGQAPADIQPAVGPARRAAELPLQGDVVAFGR